MAYNTNRHTVAQAMQLRERKHVAGDEEVGVSFIGNDVDDLAEEKTAFGRDQNLKIPFPSLAQYLYDMAEGETPGGDRNDNWGARTALKFVFELLGTAVVVWTAVFSGWFLATTLVDGEIMDEEASMGSFTVTTFLGGPIALNLMEDTDALTLVGTTLFGLEAALIQGLGWALAIFLFGFWSADYNPTYSLVVGVLPKENIGWGATFLTGLVKIGAQLVGAIIGAVLVLAIIGSAAFPDAPVPTVGDGTAFLVEFLGSLWIGYLIFTLQFNPKTSSLSNPALAVALTVALLVLFSAPLTGGVFNFAHYFGRAVFAGFNSKWWIYLVGPFAGHATAAALYVLVSRVEI